MISNLRISLAELIIWAVFATAGLAWTMARVFDGLERAWDWWRHWRELVDDLSDLEEHDPTGLELGSEIERLLDLPPERSWEQMISHQLPLEAELKGLGLPPDHDWDPGCRVRGCPVHGNWQEARERRAPWWEVQHRAAYESLGFEYPSGLMERVRASHD